MLLNNMYDNFICHDFKMYPLYYAQKTGHLSNELKNVNCCNRGLAKH